MKRRAFLTTTAAAAAAATVAAPAIAKEVIHWNMITSWPRNLPGPGIAAQRLADKITSLSNGRLQVKLHAVGELVPWNGVFDAVSEGTAELYHSVPTYWGSKSKSIMLFGSQPFGLLADEQVGWLAHGGGQELYDKTYAQFNLKPFLCGNSGQQWQGWFRKELQSVDDLKGMKYRTSGLGADVMAKLGVAVQKMGGQDMFQALQSGALDAGEFVGPWTDSALGFYQVAKYYYWPGLGEPASAEECAINMKAFNALPKDLQIVVQAACESEYNRDWTEYTTNNAKALNKLVADHGVQLRKLPADIIAAMGKATKEVIGELRDSDDALTKQVTESYLAYHQLMGQYRTYTNSALLQARASVYGYGA